MKTETAVPFKAFRDAGFAVVFVTENGKSPECDERMLSGSTQKLLGAAAPALEAYKHLQTGPEWRQPRSWADQHFSLDDIDLVFLPGGHDKGVRQILDSHRVQSLLADYFPLTKKPSKKFCAAICHGVQVLAHSNAAGDGSVLSDVTTTALPGIFESSAYNATRLFLGDYYKTYGAGTANVEEVVRSALRDARKQWRSSANPATPFVVQDEHYNYLSGRWPGDAQVLAERVIEVMRAT